MLRRILRILFGRRRSLLLSAAIAAAPLLPHLGATPLSAANAKKPAATPTTAPADPAKETTPKAAKPAPTGKQIKINITIEKGLAVEGIYIVPKKDYSELRRLLQQAAAKGTIADSAGKQYATAKAQAEKRGKEVSISIAERDAKAQTDLTSALEKIKTFLESIAPETIPVSNDTKTAKDPKDSKDAKPAKEEDVSKARKLDPVEIPQDSYLFYTWTRKIVKTTSSAFGSNTSSTTTKGQTIARPASNIILNGKGDAVASWLVPSDPADSKDAAKSEKPAKGKKTNKKK